MTDEQRFTIATNADLGDLVLQPISFQGKQALSSLYNYEVSFAVNAVEGLSSSDVDKLLKSPFAIHLAPSLGSGEVASNPGPGHTGDVHGVLRRVEATVVKHGEFPIYRAYLVPKLWYATLTSRSRVFQNKTYPDIIKAVLKEHGLEVGDEKQITDLVHGTYIASEYTVQYRETDFDFISRLMEFEGIHYHFEQQPDKEVLILGDDNTSFSTIPELAALDHQFGIAGSGAPSVADFRDIHQVRTAKVVLRDYNWRTPITPLRVEHAADATTGHGFVDSYGDHFKSSEEGTPLAEKRAQLQLRDRVTFTGVTNVVPMAPGHKIQIQGHWNPGLDGEYLVTEVTDNAPDAATAGGEGAQTISSRPAYTMTFSAIRSDVVYRPDLRVPWPEVKGLINAKVDGEARSTATPVDDEGRYRVVIPYDIGAKGGGRASRWVRRAQPSAGEGFGMHLPLHVGIEVAIAHVNADPDRPIIVGAVPNSETRSPVSSGNATQSEIRTGSGVVLQMDDDC